MAFTARATPARPVLALCVLATAFLTVGTAAVATAQVPHQTVALSGQPAPGAGGATYVSFDPFDTDISPEGVIGFVANLSAPAGAERPFPQAVYVGRAGAMDLVARSGDRAPGTEEGIFIEGGRRSGERSFQDLAMSPGGRVVFPAALTDPGGSTIIHDTSLYFAQGRAPGGPAPQAQLLARQEQPAPGGGTYGTIDTVGGFNAGGLVTFRPFLSNSGPAVITGQPGNLRTIARLGDPAPGAGAGVNFGFISNFPREPRIGPAGEISFKVDLDGAGITFENRQAVYYGSTPQDLRLLARAGSPAPGLPGLMFKGHDDSDVQTFGVESNGLGQVALSGDLSDDSRVLYVGRPDDLRLIARTGQPAPGGVGSAVDAIGQVVLGDGGFVAMTASLRDSPGGPSTAALYAGPPEALRLVARGGSRAPGTPDGVTFSDFTFALHPDSNGGFVGVQAQLSGPGVSESNDAAVVVADPAGTLYLLAREGDPFLVAPGDVRTVLTTSAPNGPSATGETTFRLRFTDGSEGLFVATVPEPAAAAWIAAAGSSCLLRRRVAGGR